MHRTAAAKSLEPAELPAVSEAHQALRALVKGPLGPLDADQLAAHALAVTQGADFPVQRAAMEALLRRVQSVRTGSFRVLARPHGTFQVQGKDGRRAYRAALRPGAPLEGSCDCPDFLRSSLSACKHILAVRVFLARPRQRALRARALDAPIFLRWDPRRPLTGPGDWMERLRWRDSQSPSASASLASARARRHFAPGDDAPLRATHPEDPIRRAALVDTLLACAAPRGRPAPAGVDPALAPLLRAEQARLRRAKELSGVRGRVAGALRGLKQKLYPYQHEGLARFLESGRLLLADDMGLGKTAQAIACCHALHATGKVRRGLLIVPAALKPQWLREWSRFTDAPAQLVEGGALERRALYARWGNGFLIANYEQVLRDLPWMRECAPELVVLDEAQRIKNWAAKTSVCVKQLSPEYRLVLTGTPVENRLDELASLLDWVDDQALEPKWRVEPWHSVYADGTREVVGARNLDTLRTRIAPCVLRRVRQEVLAQLPARRDTRVPVPLTPEQLEAHDELAQPIAALMARAQKRPLTQPEFLRLMSLLNTQRILCNGLGQARFDEVWRSVCEGRAPTEAGLQGLFSPKLLELRQLLRDLVVTQERKVVVFSQWKRMLRLGQWAVSDVLGEAGVRAVFFTGDEGQKRRTQNLVDFHDEPSTRVLFASDAGGVGLNLQRAASACINLELPWNPAVLEQRIGRIYRLGQSRAVDVFNLVSEQGIEARILGLLGDKKALFTGLFDGRSSEVAFERSGSFIRRIERVLEPVVLPAELPRARQDAEPEPELELEADESPALDAAEPPSDLDVAPAPPAPRPTLQLVPRQEEPLDTTARPASLAGALAVHLSKVQLTRTADGSLSLQAPPESAELLATLFQGMAQLLSPVSQGQVQADLGVPVEAQDLPGLSAPS